MTRANKIIESFKVNEDGDYKETLKNLQDRKKERTAELADYKGRLSKVGPSDKELKKRIKGSIDHLQQVIKFYDKRIKEVGDKKGENLDEATISGEHAKKWDSLSDRVSKTMKQAYAEEDANGSTKKYYQLRAQAKKLQIEQDKVMITFLKTLDGDKSKQISHYQEQIKKLEAQVKEEMKMASEADK